MKSNRCTSFRLQMVHQSSSCYKDLTLYHFVMSHTSVRLGRVTNWKSVCIALCRWSLCSICRNLYRAKSILGSNQFLFLFEKNYCELYRLLREAYGEYSPSQDTCERWFGSFKSCDFGTRHGTWKTSKTIANIVGRR